jgi:hypothetical protein
MTERITLTRVYATQPDEGRIVKALKLVIEKSTTPDPEGAAQ